jgi:hypothetical protein
VASGQVAEHGASSSRSNVSVQLELIPLISMEHVGSKLMDNVTNGENMGASILPNTPFEIQVDDVAT